MTANFAGGIPDSLSFFLLNPDGTLLVTTDLLGGALFEIDLDGTVVVTGGTTPAVLTQVTGPVGPDQSVAEDAGPQVAADFAARILAGPVDEAGQALTFLVNSDNPGLFAAAPAITPDGTLTYTPAPDANGQATVTVRLQDDGGTANGGVDTSTAQAFTITVNQVNDAPIANPDIVEIAEDTPTLIAASTLLANDTDVDGNVLTLTGVGNGVNGTVVLDQNGNPVFTPVLDFNGLASFEYTISDGNGGTATSIVAITVTPVNDAPIANPDIVEIAEDTPTLIAASTLLANDTDVDGNVLTLTGVGNGVNGTVVLDQNGNPVFTPVLDFNGLASFEYTISDGNGGAATSIVAITVTSVNDAPIANPDIVEIAEDTPTLIAASTLLANDTDVDGNVLTLTGVGNGVNGTVVLDQNGNPVFTPDLDFNGPASFEYTISDGNGGTATSTVAITVTAVNDVPVALNDAYEASKNTPLVVLGGDGVLGNDTDIESDALTSTVVTNPVHGSLTLNSDGSFTYVPTLNFTGTDAFTYRANDGTVDSNVALVEISVIAPVINVDSLVLVKYSGLMFNRATNTFDTLATITNTSTDSLLLEPMSLVITSITPSGVTLANATGQTADGKPFVSVPVPAVGLAPGQKIANILLKFSDPTRVRFTFTTSVLAVDPPVSLVAAQTSSGASTRPDRLSPVVELFWRVLGQGRPGPRRGVGETLGASLPAGSGR